MGLLSGFISFRKYDVFISYRREGGAEFARLIQLELKEKYNLKPYLDVDDLNSSYFDEQILKKIESIPNFILILTQGSLERFSNPDDWVRKELFHAIITKRNIIPVLKDGFQFPNMNHLPEIFKDLNRYQNVEYSHMYHNAAISRLVGYLKSKNNVCLQTGIIENRKEIEIHNINPSSIIQDNRENVGQTHIFLENEKNDQGTTLNEPKTHLKPLVQIPDPINKIPVQSKKRSEYDININGSILLKDSSVLKFECIASYSDMSGDTMAFNEAPLDTPDISAPSLFIKYRNIKEIEFKDEFDVKASFYSSTSKTYSDKSGRFIHVTIITSDNQKLYVFSSKGAGWGKIIYDIGISSQGIIRKVERERIRKITIDNHSTVFKLPDFREDTKGRAVYITGEEFVFDCTGFKNFKLIDGNPSDMNSKPMDITIDLEDISHITFGKKIEHQKKGRENELCDCRWLEVFVTLKNGNKHLFFATAPYRDNQNIFACGYTPSVKVLTFYSQFVRRETDIIALKEIWFN